jgi:hypothetical protein
MLLQFFSTLFGYNYEVVKVQSTLSKQKIVTLGTLVFIPVSLWFFSGFYLSTSLYGISWEYAAGIGAILSILIFTIDRAFIVLSKENGGKELAKFRVFIAILSTVLGSLAMDLMLFSGDLKEYQAAKNQRLKEEKIFEYKKDFGGTLERLSSERKVASDTYDQAYKEYSSEVDGTNGTGKYGLGPAANVKGKRMNDSKMALDQANESFLAEQSRLEAEAESIASSVTSMESSSVISKIRDLHEFAFSGFINALYYLVVTAFFFCLEFFPFKYKSKTAESLFEKMLCAEEIVGERRLQSILSQREEILRQNGLFGNRADRIRQLASETNPLQRIG